MTSPMQAIQQITESHQMTINTLVAARHGLIKSRDFLTEEHRQTINVIEGSFNVQISQITQSLEKLGYTEPTEGASDTTPKGRAAPQKEDKQKRSLSQKIKGAYLPGTPSYLSGKARDKNMDSK